ncbi:hypothetical protein ACIBG8_15180 [Nonomuraea sp. NPDC050556]|uniref:hypothetical protein n=1 Tax=Nonomuraea sp. NPDC050556 TaxID=3364369 RepID=UPI0037B34B05
MRRTLGSAGAVAQVAGGYRLDADAGRQRTGRAVPGDGRPRRSGGGAGEGVRGGDLPILSPAAVNVAAPAGALGQRHESAVVLGAAARLRGAHDRTDPQVSEVTRRGRAVLGEEAFAAAYEKGWELDAQTAVTEVDPARLRR